MIPRVLMYHLVGTGGDAAMSVPLTAFLRHLRYLTAAGYRTVDLRTFESRLHGRDSDGREVLLTFDDGYSNTTDIVAPLLREHGLHATMAVCSAYLEPEHTPRRTSHLSDDFAGPEQVRDWVAAGNGDHVFGTALNRFCVQAVTESRITVYGSGQQHRSFLNIHDTLQCVELATLNPAEPGEFRVFNQFTEVFSILELANLVVKCARRAGYEPTVAHLTNPRAEAEKHYYNPSNKGLLNLGLKPVFLSDDLLDTTLTVLSRYRDRVNLQAMEPTTLWR